MFLIQCHGSLNLKSSALDKNNSKSLERLIFNTHVQMRVNTLFCLSWFMKLSFWMKRVCVLMEFSYGAHQVILYMTIYGMWLTLTRFHHFISFPLVRKNTYELHRNLFIVLHGGFEVYENSDGIQYTMRFMGKKGSLKTFYFKISSKNFKTFSKYI